MPNRLADIEVEEISGVDKAANRRRFLLMKREGGEQTDVDKEPREAEAGQQKPETIKKQGFLARIAEGIRSVFKVEASTFVEEVQQSQLREKYWLAFDALRAAIDSTLADESLTPEQKVQQVAVSLGQFQEFILGLVTAGAGVGVQKGDTSDSVAEGVQKVGAKIARHRLDKIRSAYAVLGEILAEVGPDEEADDVNKEEVLKVVEEAVTGKVAEVTKRIDPLAELPGKVEELLKQQDDLAKRVEALENLKGVRKSVEGQDDNQRDVKKSIWTGIF